MPVTDGAELLLADTPEALAAAVVRLLKDKDFAKTLATRAAETVRVKYGWDGVASSFAGICEEAVRASRAKGSAARLTESVEAI